jgi:predicted Zn-dependent peptidase
MESLRHQTSTLPNGLRIGTVELPDRRVAALGVWTGTGSRHEPARLAGVAHLVEHMVFKGTARRSARKISLDIEGVGGELNAFTSEDHTCYHAVVPADRLDTAADVLADIFRNARYSERDCRREKEVILEEIQMYRENPGQHVEDLLSEAVWPDHPLGRIITGTAASLARLGGAELREWTDRTHVAANTVLAVASPWPHDEVVKKLRPLFGSLPVGKPARALPFPVRRATASRRETRETEQTHLALGFRIPGRRHPSRHATRLLSVLAGEAMGSRLFHALREQRGLCYAVHTETDVFAETGLFEVYTAVETGKLEAATRALGRELGKLVTHPPKQAELARARAFALGQQDLWFESTVNQMNWVGECLLWYGRVLAPDAARARLLAVSPAEVAASAARTFRTRKPALALIGPHANTAPVEKWLAGV